MKNAGIAGFFVIVRIAKSRNDKNFARFTQKINDSRLDSPHKSKLLPNLPQSILGFFGRKSRRCAPLRFVCKVLVQAHCPLLWCF